MTAAPAPIPDSIERRTLSRINRRVLPFLSILYVVAFLDRVNISFAGLRMTRELGLTPSQFGFAAGIFFAGYMLLEIPGAILSEVWSAHKWLTRIMISWGFLAAATGSVQNAQQL